MLSQPSTEVETRVWSVHKGIGIFGKLMRRKQWSIGSARVLQIQTITHPYSPSPSILSPFLCRVATQANRGAGEGANAYKARWIRLASMREDLKTTHSSLQIYQYISWPQVIRESHERSLLLSGLVFVWDYVEQNLDWLICNPMFFYFKFFRSFVSRNLKGRPYIIRAPDLRGQAQKRGEWDELLYLAQELAQDTWLLAQL